MTHYVYAITFPVLIPLSEPQEGGDFLLSKSALDESFRFRDDLLHIGPSF